MDTRWHSRGFLDRFPERSVLAQLLADVRAGRSQTLVLRGEAGVGKSTLLQVVSEAADGCMILRATGVESESELAFAGVHSLCAPVLGSLEQLPEPQQEALGVALGQRVGAPPDRFLVGLAVLSLLAAIAEEQPLLCIVDDVQWLDRASSDALAFVARRLLAEPVGVLFAVREANVDDAFEGLPQLVIDGLPNDDAQTLLDSIVLGPLDQAVKARILDEARGNPLALIELPRGLTPAEFAGGFGLPKSQTLTSRIVQSFTRRIEALPPQTKLLLLIAASEPLGDVGLLWDAAGQLGIGTEAGRPAEEAGLIDLNAHVRFAHPLIRSAVTDAFGPSEHREVRRALAGVTDPQRDPDRRAWHLAHATSVPDEYVASEMLRSADRARARGGMAAAAAFLQRAADLTPDPSSRVDRSLDAAQAKLAVADAAAATALLNGVAHGPLSDLHRARLERLRAELVFHNQRGLDSPRLLLEAARQLEPLDPTLASDTYLEAISSAMYAGRLGAGPSAWDVAEAASGVVTAEPRRQADLLLNGLVARYTDGYGRSVESLSRALAAIRDSDGGEYNLHVSISAYRIATDLWDDELWFELATRGARFARETGALTLLPIALNHLAAVNVHSGAFAAAAALGDEVTLIARAAGLPPLEYSRFKLAATRGDRKALQLMIDGPVQEAASRGEGAAVGMKWALLALMHNSYGEYDLALAAAQQGCEFDEVMAYNASLVELIEAGVRAGNRDVAAAGFGILSERTGAAGTPWARGVEARSHALLHGDESSYLESIHQLSLCRAAVDLARGQLVYGEWLRRENRRSDARKQLRAAHESFSGMGADGFAERARRELLATGETARRSTPDNWSTLTPQELQIARLARDGYTNPEIGAQLFISPRTVEYHLYKVFRKLDVTSRRGLRNALVDSSHQAARGHL